MNWYINRKTNELVQGKLIGEHILSIRIDDYWELKDASQYDEAMICPEYKTCTQDCCDSHNEPHIKQERCSLTFCETDNGCEIYCPCIPYIPEQKLANEEPVFPICGTCNARKDSKPDSSLLLSDEKMDEAYCLVDLKNDKYGHHAIAKAELDHLAKPEMEIYKQVKCGLVDEYGIPKHTIECVGCKRKCVEYIPLSDYIKGEGK